MFGLGALPAIIQIVGLAFLPESPRYLLSSATEQLEAGSACTASTSNESAFADALDALHQLRPSGHDVKTECEKLRSSLREQGADRGILQTFVEIVKVSHVRRALIIGCSMQMFQQIVGINTVMYYCSSIVQMAGVPDKEAALLYSAIISAVYGFFAVAVLFVIETLGRRRLFIASCTSVTIGLLLLTVSFYLVNESAPNLSYKEQGATSSDSCSDITNCNQCALERDCGVCYLDLENTNKRVDQGSCVATDTEVSSYPDYYSTYGRCDEQNMERNRNSSLVYATDACPSKFAPLIVVALLFYLIAFSIGMAPIPWVYNSEIYPQWARSTAVSIATTTNWTFNLIISVSFLSLVDTITQAGTFGVYAFFALLSVFFFHRLMPETKGVELERIEQLFGHEFEAFSCSNPSANYSSLSTEEE